MLLTGYKFSMGFKMLLFMIQVPALITLPHNVIENVWKWIIMVSCIWIQMDAHGCTHADVHNA